MTKPAALALLLAAAPAFAIEPYQAKPIAPYRAKSIEPVQAKPIEPYHAKSIEPVQARPIAPVQPKPVEATPPAPAAPASTPAAGPASTPSKPPAPAPAPGPSGPPTYLYAKYQCYRLGFNAQVLITNVTFTLRKDGTYIDPLGKKARYRLSTQDGSITFLDGNLKPARGSYERLADGTPRVYLSYDASGWSGLNCAGER